MLRVGPAPLQTLGSSLCIQTMPCCAVRAGRSSRLDGAACPRNVTGTALSRCGGGTGSAGRVCVQARPGTGETGDPQVQPRLPLARPSLISRGSPCTSQGGCKRGVHFLLFQERETLGGCPFASPWSRPVGLGSLGSLDGPPGLAGWVSVSPALPRPHHLQGAEFFGARGVFTPHSRCQQKSNEGRAVASLL